MTDPEAIRMVNEMKDIVKMPNPYREIQRLPELRSKFILVFVELLNEESKLVEIAINSNKESTLNYLENVHISEGKKYELTSKINQRFQKLLDELGKAKVFRDAIFKKDEASKAKELLIQEIDRIEKEEAKDKPGGGGVVNDPPFPSKKVKKLNLTSYAKAFKDVESDSDLEDVVNKFRELLKEEMQNNHVIKFY
ncbi:MAG: hypothetical protein K8R73_09030 [Clostridiales bacterium]|nr:hypothetical protein [Clostridiales bacterium]